MVYTLFFSWMRDLEPDVEAEYVERASALRARATAQHPGFVDLKTYVADDGERLTVTRFADLESQKGWARDPQHRVGQARGREVYYERYRIVVCETLREREWSCQGAETSREEG